MRRPCNHRIHPEYGGRVVLKTGGTVVPPSNFQTKITEICTHKAFPTNQLHGHGHAHVPARTKQTKASLSKSAVAALSRKSRKRAKFAGLPLQRPTPGARSVTITTAHCALIRQSIVSTFSERNAAVGYGAQPRDKSNPSVGYYDPTRAKHGL